MTNFKRFDSLVYVKPHELITGDSLSPGQSQNVSYRIRAISNYFVAGPVSNLVTISDLKRPRLVSAIVVSPAGSTDYDYVYVRFSEPMNRFSVETEANYSITDYNGRIANLRFPVYLGYDTINPCGNGYKVRITVDDLSIIPGETLVVYPVMDLSGNTIETDYYAYTF